MRIHTVAFKNKIKEFGRELDSVITYEENGETVVLGGEQLNAITPHYEGAILKSVMKQLDIDSNVDIPVGTILNYQLGVKTRYNTVSNYRDNYDYIDYGNYVVYSSEIQEDTRSYRIVCYDKLLYSMIDYTTPVVNNTPITYPITVRDYISAICSHLGLTFANSTDTFANYDTEIASELYLDNEGKSLGYKFRDVLDELAQVTASIICINADDELEVRYLTDTNDTINEEYLKDINVNFGESFGAINTVVLTRSAGSDSIYRPTILPENPVEFKIEDNQILNNNDREDFIDDIYDTLNGLEYYINDFSSTGICYLEIGDKYNIQIGNKTYNCVMLNDEVNITQGLEESVYTPLPEETNTDYSKADKTDRKINQTYIIVDKQNGTIEELATRLTDDESTLSTTVRRQDAFGERLEVINTNIDENGNVTEVTTTNGYTFNKDGLNIYTSENDFNTQITNEGTYYKDGDDVIGQYTKDGSKQRDLELFGIYKYGMRDIDDTPMFIAQLYTDKNGDEAFGHFYNKGDY